MDLFIPFLVESAILAHRAYLIELNRKAHQYNIENNITFGGISFPTKSLELDTERQFWSMEEDMALQTFLMEDLLALYPEASWQALPRGYKPLIDVLEFERHCDCEGWLSVSHKGEIEMRQIIQSYAFIGLQDEARALTAVTNAFLPLCGEEASPHFSKTLSKAYRSVPNSTPERDDRMRVVCEFVRKHPALFGV